jgi:hypothetical protein
MALLKVVSTWGTPGYFSGWGEGLQPENVLTNFRSNRLREFYNFY